MLSIKKIYKAAKEYDSKLQANDKRFRYTVHITNMDGSVFTFDSAFLMTMDDELYKGRHPNPGPNDSEYEKWIIVFSEHHGYHVYHETDLTFWAQYKRIYKIEKLDGNL